MSKFHGKAGSVFWDTEGGNVTVLNILSWNAEISGHLTEVTVMGTAHKQYGGGLQDWTASVTCLLDSSGSNVPLVGNGDAGLGEDFKGGGDAGDAPATLKLMLNASDYIDGPAIAQGVSAGTTVDGASTVTYSFQGTGEATFTNASA